MPARRRSSIAALLLALACDSSTTIATGHPPAEWRSHGGDGITIEYRSQDAAVSDALLADARAARSLAATFFAEPLAVAATVRVFPDRASFEAWWREHAPGFQPQCWMIARARPGVVEMLSPRVWSTAACGHDGTDAAYVRRVMTHELVHVLHASVNALPDVNGAQELKWFNEGVAVLASGQFDAAARARVSALVRAGNVPARLADIWGQSSAYDLGGSLAAYLDATYGRVRLAQLLRARSTTELLAQLGTDEATLLAQWRVYAR